MEELFQRYAQEQEQLEWERADMEREAMREARADEERAIRAAGGTVETEQDPFDFTRELPERPELDTEDVPF